MKKTIYSPGPWQRDDRLPANGRPVIARTAGRIPISATTDDWLGSPEEDEANAWLIAAAPELLETLKDMVGAFEEYAEDWEPDSVGVDILLKARAAIAKATGQGEADEEEWEA